MCANGLPSLAHTTFDIYLDQDEFKFCNQKLIKCSVEQSPVIISIIKICTVHAFDQLTGFIKDEGGRNSSNVK